MSVKGNLRKNFAYSITYQIMVIILPLITAPYVTRVLGATNLGIYSYTQATANYFYLFAMLGVNNYGNRAIARVRDGGHDTLRRCFWGVYGFQFISSFVFLLAYLFFCVFIAHENSLFFYLQIFYVISATFDANWFCFGVENFRLTTIRSTVVRILSAICIFIFVHSEGDLWIYTFIMSFSFIVSSIAVWPFIIREIGFYRPKWKDIKPHIKPNLVLFWPVIAVSLYNIMDKLMLGWFSDKDEVAFYSYAERIVTIPTTLILALDNVMMPRMSNLYASEGKSENIKYLMDNVMLFAMFMAAAMGFGLAGVSDVFAPWFYGYKFARCGYFIFLLSPVIIVKAWAGALRTQFIIPTGRDKIYVASLTIGAAINLILNLCLIPRLNGVGAIIGTLAAEFSVCFIQFFWCRKDIEIKSYLLNGVSFCAIGMIMFFAIEALSHVSNHAVITMAIQIICGAIIYILLGSLFMVKIRKNPVLVNEGLKMLRIKYRFK